MSFRVVDSGPGKGGLKYSRQQSGSALIKDTVTAGCSFYQGRLQPGCSFFQGQLQPGYSFFNGRSVTKGAAGGAPDVKGR